MQVIVFFLVVSAAIGARSRERERRSRLALVAVSTVVASLLYTYEFV